MDNPAGTGKGRSTFELERGVVPVPYYQCGAHSHTAPSGTVHVVVSAQALSRDGPAPAGGTAAPCHDATTGGRAASTHMSREKTARPRAQCRLRPTSGPYGPGLLGIHIRAAI
jgi:hypothetical protein